MLFRLNLAKFIRSSSEHGPLRYSEWLAEFEGNFKLLSTICTLCRFQEPNNLRLQKTVPEEKNSDLQIYIIKTHGTSVSFSNSCNVFAKSQEDIQKIKNSLYIGIMLGNANLDEGDKKTLLAQRLDYFLEPSSKVVLPNTYEYPKTLKMSPCM